MDIINPDSVLSLSKEPNDEESFNKWIEQNDICPFLEKEIQDEHIIIYASLPYTFIYSALIPATDFDEPDIQDLLKWDVSPTSSWGEVYSSDSVWIEPPLASSDSKLLSEGEQILISRYFDGDNSMRPYYELTQKITHILDIHFMSERNAWCKLNKFGDIEDVVKITKIDSTNRLDDGTIISMQKKALGKYAALTDSTLLRMFDFTRYKRGSFGGWHSKPEKPLEGVNNIFGRLVVEPGYGSYARGIQIADIRIDKQNLIRTWGRSIDVEDKKYATYTAIDWKHNVIKEISCDPSGLGNYFVESDLPFGTSPAFFRPEVLSKYKSDREKYQLKARSVSCRGAWELKTFDINDAGQVHTYLVYLSNLPYEEQLHWKQYNEAPKAPISARAFKTDFEGEFYEEDDALESLKRKLYELTAANVEWWVLRDPHAIDKVHYPYTTSKDEWAEEILNLDQLLVEGFEEKWVRRKARDLGRNPDDKFRSLKLIEECLVGVGFDEAHARELLGPFHEVHNLRSKLKGHTSGQEAAQIRKDALRDFGSLRKQFENLCARCDDSLKTIINAFKGF
jgi:hypothetical protein